nr:immunoglobulin light chain junction region [Mus musculus]NSM00614.1 immunoglobulin light chain junction region [Mus musculus]NSM00762.1 immunoglobulin light chain junction region [Mus musculus]NSM02532.1 immunoglobulin light chain junction region [Mus musculus]NSM02871.1 immunoglobulin light chain junction region [Mus musculus]
CQQRSSYPYTF